MLYHRQIKGIIAIVMLLAVIPFFHYVHNEAYDLQGPSLSLSQNQTIAVELIDSTGTSGIYFIEPSVTLKRLLKNIDSNAISEDDRILENGTSIKMPHKGETSGIIFDKIPAEKKMALGVPLDVNGASLDDLMQVPGVGESTAQKIINRRREVGKFIRLEQLKEISGIKERKLLTLSQYLYVDKTQK